MAEEGRLKTHANSRKTLANCKNSEFMAQANKTRKLVNEYYHKINIPAIAANYKEKYQDKDAEQSNEVSREFITDVFTTMLEEYPVDTIGVIAVMGFMTVDEAEEVDPSELLKIVFECISSQRVLDFFINVEVLVGSGTDSILPILMYFKQIFTAKNTSGNESNTNTENTQNE